MTSYTLLFLSIKYSVLMKLAEISKWCFKNVQANTGFFSFVVDSYDVIVLAEARALCARQRIDRMDRVVTCRRTASLPVLHSSLLHEETHVVTEFSVSHLFAKVLAPTVEHVLTYVVPDGIVVLLVRQLSHPLTTLTQSVSDEALVTLLQVFELSRGGRQGLSVLTVVVPVHT